MAYVGELIFLTIKAEKPNRLDGATVRAALPCNNEPPRRFASSADRLASRRQCIKWRHREPSFG